MEKELIKKLKEITKELENSKNKKDFIITLKNLNLLTLDAIKTQNDTANNKSITLNTIISLKEIFFKNQHNILEIANDEENSFLDDIKEEVLKKKAKISEIISKLSHSDLNESELEQVETKYNKLKILLDEKVLLEKKYLELKEIDFNTLELEVKNIKNELNELSKKEIGLNEEKSNLEKKLDEINKYNNIIDQKKSSIKTNLNDFIINIEKSIDFLKYNYNDLYKKREFILNKITEETNNIKNLQLENEKLLEDLNNKIKFFEKTSQAKKDNLAYNKNIFDNLPEVSQKLENRMTALDYELKTLEKDLYNHIKNFQSKYDEFFSTKFFL
ncbi:MAG: hypothetical protein U0457_01925 [Candidatus Sericytochromatia bacterium]